jgi:hypothetical protein
LIVDQATPTDQLPKVTPGFPSAETIAMPTVAGTDLCSS